MNNERYFTIHIYGPESDYTYEQVTGVDFKKLGEAQKWIEKYLPKHLGYKIVKSETVVKKSPAPPHYLT